ncbi:predicted protein [Thalassiosira pseudonana CCMP1335]|uniref:Uncharacterized protein n=1 Tax=Thalassiosira pseudonana TaxID=35128 RepID=B5YLX9_THAPS|nr:predicted protein [Thalassiosira pseudonana CCMP1335]ACI64156.1 predicted protein [Thalassiosira pseudonana CCMP1335]
MATQDEQSNNEEGNSKRWRCLLLISFIPLLAASIVLGILLMDVSMFSPRHAREQPDQSQSLNRTSNLRPFHGENKMVGQNDYPETEIVHSPQTHQEEYQDYPEEAERLKEGLFSSHQVRSYAMGC